MIVHRRRNRKRQAGSPPESPVLPIKQFRRLVRFYQQLEREDELLQALRCGWLPNILVHASRVLCLDGSTICPRSIDLWFMLKTKFHAGFSNKKRRDYQSHFDAIRQ